MDSKIEPVAWLTVAANMRAALISMQVGGCTCDTKSPALEFHDIRCRYRQAAELDGVLETLTDEVVAALLAAEQRGREAAADYVVTWVDGRTPSELTAEQREAMEFVKDMLRTIAAAIRKGE